MAGSEVAQLRQQIADEYLAARMGLTGLASGTGRHQFITARMEQMGKTLTQLTQIVGAQEAMRVVAITLEDQPEQVTRFHVVDLLQRSLEKTEETAILIDRIEEMWETMDMLQERFGASYARIIIDIPSSFLFEGEEE